MKREYTVNYLLCFFMYEICISILLRMILSAKQVPVLLIFLLRDKYMPPKLINTFELHECTCTCIYHSGTLKQQLFVNISLSLHNIFKTFNIKEDLLRTYDDLRKIYNGKGNHRCLIS